MLHGIIDVIFFLINLVNVGRLHGIIDAVKHTSFQKKTNMTCK